MRVTLDATPITPNPSGVGFYTGKLLEELTATAALTDLEVEPVYQIRLKQALSGKFMVPAPLRHYSNVRYVPMPVRLTNLFIRHPRLCLPFVERAFGSPSIYHGTNCSVLPFRKCRNVLTLYDLNFIKYPQFCTDTVKAYADSVRRCLAWTDLVLAISESTKRDLVTLLGFPADRVKVTPLASHYGPHYKSATTQVPDYDLTRPYILFVSTIEPRKNLVRLIEAYEYLKDTRKIPHDLVLIGQKGWLFEPIFDRIARSSHRASIRYLSYLPNDSVAAFYQRADVFVFPSHYEGFGLPVLEAMTLGAPVVCANNSSLPEVAGDAAVMVDADSALEIADGIRRVIENPTFRRELIQRGHAQAAKFSWQQTAKETFKAYKALN